MYCEVPSPPFVDLTEAESKEKHACCMGPYAGATITSPDVHSRVDSNTFTTGIPPESNLNLCQSRLYPLVRDFGFGLCFQETGSECKSGTEWSDTNENMETDELISN